MSSKDSHLYNPRPSNLNKGKEISSSTTLSFTSQLSSLINAPSPATTKPSSRPKPKKEDLFHRPKGNSAKRAKRDHEYSPAFEQKHTTDGESLEAGQWARSQRKMEEKARLYAAMKRGDVEDEKGVYGVDFDRKWAEGHPDGYDGVSSSEDDGEEEVEVVEYTDEFGRTRTGTRREVERLKRGENARAALASDEFTARPLAPAEGNLIRGDTIQHAAFNPDAEVVDQMSELAKKRDRSLTPPGDTHFDASKEVRRKGTGFFQFSGEEGERARQMRGLEEERKETERVRAEAEGKREERKRKMEARRREIMDRKGRRLADEFLDGLGEELGEKIEDGQGEGGRQGR